MHKYLVIVESPAKVKTISKFLGANYKVMASQGHVRDLPKSQMGVDVEHDYEPKYITIRGKGDILAALRKEAKKADKVYLATDPDREGEAISWHLAAALKLEDKDIYRITFNEITTGAHDDFKKATKIARSMVTEYGMSSLGPMRLEEGEGNTFLGRDYTKNRNISDTVAHEIDEEMRKIINECYEKAKKIIKENKKILDLIANALIENETITKEQIDNLVKYGKIEIDEEVKEDIEEKSKGTKSKKEKNQ